MSDTIQIIQAGNVQEVEFEEGMTVESALEAAGITVGTGIEVRLNNRVLRDLEVELAANQTLLLVGAVRGA